MKDPGLGIVRKRPEICLCLALAVLACACAVGAARAQRPASVDKISFSVADAFEPGAAVSGDLRIPESTRERLAAVLILHSSPGFDGRGAFYAEALNAAGIATIEIDYLRGRGLPATPRHNLPHAYETLQRLAAHPRIDPARIGIMGFSWGGHLAVLTSSDELTQQYTRGAPRFAAHLGLYPICWMYRAAPGGAPRYFPPSTFGRLTGRPVHILVGDQDGGDAPDGCQRFLADLPEQARAHVALTVYPGATFGWDSRFGSSGYFIGARQGKGGIVQTVADPELAKRSRDFAVTFFRKSLDAD